MKKSLGLLILFLILSSSIFAEEPKYPTSFSCVIEEEYQENEAATPKKDIFNYYQIDQIYRWDAFGIAYILDDNKQMYYQVILRMKVYTESKMSKSVPEILNSLGGGFLNPANFSNVEDTGRTEIINGYECKIMQVNLDKKDKITRLVWQAPLLGNLGMKFEASKGAAKDTKLVTNLVLGFKDMTVFNLPEGGKSNLIMVN